ncbi:hypothetical protein [Saccharomonospora marina]|uniref:hypothetical protein n=1 Tax=Saccharomonospora marina TaxID=632569 RepID=UPI001E3A2413|nr:hypothetical protein [Saccharomonospora marina]
MAASSAGPAAILAAPTAGTRIDIINTSKTSTKALAWTAASGPARVVVALVLIVVDRQIGLDRDDPRVLGA